MGAEALKVACRPPVCTGAAATRGGGGTHPAPATAAATRKHCLSPFLPPHRLPRVLAVNHYLHPISSLGYHSFFLVKP